MNGQAITRLAWDSDVTVALHAMLCCHITSIYHVLPDRALHMHVQQLYCRNVWVQDPRWGTRGPRSL